MTVATKTQVNGPFADTEVTVTALGSEPNTHVFRIFALTPTEIALVKSTAAK